MIEVLDVTNLPSILRIVISYDPSIDPYNPLTTAVSFQHTVWVFLVDGGAAWIWEGSEYEAALVAAENLRRRYPGVPIFHWGTELRADG